MTWNRKRYWTLFVKTGPSCNAGCVSCPSGLKRPGDTEPIPLMKLDIFRRILDRAEEQGGLVSVVLHYFNEPGLNPHIASLVEHAHRRGVVTAMSTNGSFPDQTHACVLAGLTNLIISASGWTNEIHQRSHKGVNVELVRGSMRRAAQARKPGQFMRVGWHDYLYNRHEQPQMREFAESLGFKFTPYQTSVLPVEAVIQRFHELEAEPGREFDPLPQERDLLLKLPEAKKLCDERRHFSCVLQHGMFAVDGNGVLYNCCAKGNAAGNRRESIFDVSLEGFDRRRKQDPDCASCKSVGAHVYGTQKQTAPLGFGGEAYRLAEDWWRKLGVGGRFPKLTAKVGGWLYERPGKARRTA